MHNIIFIQFWFFYNVGRLWEANWSYLHRRRVLCRNIYLPFSSPVCLCQSESIFHSLWKRLADQHWAWNFDISSLRLHISPSRHTSFPFWLESLAGIPSDYALIFWIKINSETSTCFLKQFTLRFGLSFRCGYLIIFLAFILVL